MELLPVSFYEYLSLFLLCFISFIIGWLAGRRKEVPSIKNEQFKRGINLDITTSKKEVRAVQTRERGGNAVRNVIRNIERNDDMYRRFTIEPNSEEGETAEVKDDLKRINGIGAVIEDKLNEIGIYRFSQISKFTPHDIETVAAYLESFPKKIEKENWIEQAKELQKSQARKTD